MVLDGNPLAYESRKLNDRDKGGAHEKEIAYGWVQGSILGKDESFFWLLDLRHKLSASRSQTSRTQWSRRMRVTIKKEIVQQNSHSSKRGQWLQMVWLTGLIPPPFPINI